jgi:hypothetical protein
MNLVRQREALKDMQQAGYFTEYALRNFLACPVFHYPVDIAFRDLSQEEEEYFEQQMTGRNEPHLPYNCFRIYDSTYMWGFSKMKNDADGTPLWLIVVQWQDSGGGLTSRPIELRAYAVARFVAGPSLCTMRIDLQRASNHNTHFERGSELFKVAQKWIGSHSPELIGRFSLDVMTPSNTILKVGPAKNGKSVEWRLARTHYLILHPAQARLCQKQSRGPSPQQLLRAAHWRRGHFRRLNSEKFKTKRGLLVPVRQAWVGPKEWIGTDQKIYSVVDTHPHP